MRRIRLFPVRKDESENYQARWRRRSQVLGSVLHWAHDAGAIRIEFDPAQAEPFHYITLDGKRVTTETGEPPSEIVDSLASLVRDAIDGHPLWRPIRSLARRLMKAPIEARFEIFPTEVYAGSVWSCTMDGDTAVFLKESDQEPIANVEK